MSYDHLKPERIPPQLRASLDRYAAQGIPTGDCLRHALSNDYLGFFKRADPETAQAAAAIAAYIYNELPHNCHGSEDVVDAWIERHLDRARAEAEVTG